MVEKIYYGYIVNDMGKEMFIFVLKSYLKHKVAHASLLYQYSIKTIDLSCLYELAFGCSFE